MVVTEKLTRKIEVRKPLTPETKDELLKQISGAYKIITDKEFEISGHKESIAELKEDIDEQQSIVASIVAKYDKGYESKEIECFVTYNGNEVTFTDETSGEIVEQRVMTEAEQLQLSENRIDAEDIIRQAEKED